MPYIAKKVKIDAILYSMGGLTGLEIEDIVEIKKGESKDKKDVQEAE